MEMRRGLGIESIMIWGREGGGVDERDVVIV